MKKKKAKRIGRIVTRDKEHRQPQYTVVNDTQVSD